MAKNAFADLGIWDIARENLPWYYAVANNIMPAKYLISKRIACDAELNADEGELWKEHERLTKVFLERWSAMRNRESKLSDFDVSKPSLLDLSVELVDRMLAHCNFCRWNCRVDRSKGTKHGTCQLESVSWVSSYFHHRGEELVFRGTEGSGTIFFTSCNLRCSFCQNSDISNDKDNGIPITPHLLALMGWQLRMEGCHNINFVGGEPTIHLHTIIEAISLLEIQKPSPKDIAYIQQTKADFYGYPMNPEGAYYFEEFNAPILWNSNFFMSEETMKLLRPLVDIWLPDFKFGSDKCAIFLSRTPWYSETVSRNHKLIHDWGEDLVIRHLVMPGHVECCTKPVLEWISRNMPRVLVNIMDQYHPDYACNPGLPSYQEKYMGLSRPPTSKEIREAYTYAEKLGLKYEAVSLEKKSALL